MKRIIWSRFFRNLVPMLRVGTSRHSTGKRAAKKPSTRALVRPRLECLEDRTLPSQMPTFTVTAPGDAGVGVTTPTAVAGDIRYVIDQANNPAYAGAVINFSTASIGSNIIALTHGELEITNSIDIEGPGAASLTISGNTNGILPIAGISASRVFNITSPLAVVTIAGLTITGGNGAVNPLTTPGNQGGDIFNGGNLTLNNDIIQDGYVLGAVGGPPARGGGIFNASGKNGATGATLTLSGTTIESNEAEGATGADSAYFSVSGGPGGFGAGGGIYNDANATLNINTIKGNVQIINNTALGGNGGKGLNGLKPSGTPKTGPGFSGGPGGNGGSGGAALGGGLFNSNGGNLSITGNSTSSIIIADNVAQGGIGGNGDFGGAGGNGGKSGSGGKGGNGGSGGEGGSTLGGGLYSSGSILSLEYVQFAGNQAVGGAGGTGSFGGKAGDGGSKGAGGIGGAGGAGGSGGSAGGGAIYSSGGAVSLAILNSQFTTDSAGTGNQAIGGAGNNGSTGGNGGNGSGTKISDTQFPAGGPAGAGGAAGGGGNALGGAVLNAGGDVSFTSVTATTTLAQGGVGGVGGVGGTGGVGGVHTRGGLAGVGGAGGTGGTAQGGGVYNNGGSLTFTDFTSSNSQANAGNGNAGGNAGVGGVGGKGGGGNADTGSISAFGASGATGGVGGAAGAGGAAQGGGFYNSGGALTITTSKFTNDSVTSGSGSTGGNGGNGGVGGVSGKKGFISGNGGIGGAAGAGGDAGYADGGGGTNAGGDVSITASTFTADLVRAGNGGTGGTGGNGGEGGDANAGNGSSGSGGDGGQGGNGGGGSTAQGGGLSVTAGTLSISTTTFGGGAALADQVLGGNGGAGGNGGVINFSGAPFHEYTVFPPQIPNGGDGGIGGAGTSVSGGGLAVSSSTPPANVNVLNSFVGIDWDNSNSTEPPDTQGAVGPSSYIETVNQAVAIYDKSTGGAISTDSLSDFFFTQGGLAHVSNPDFQGDSFITFDPLAYNGQGCFVVGDLEVAVDPVTGQPGSTDGSANALLLAVSKTDDPATLTSADWYFYEVDTTLPTVALQDYPGNVGYNADALVITQNSFSTTADIGTFVNAISISALTSGAPLTLGTNLFQNEYTPVQLPLLLRPAAMTDAQPGGPMWFVASDGEGGESIPSIGANIIDVVEMTDVLSANPTFTTTTLTVNPYYQNQPPIQPDGGEIFGAIDSRILNANESNGLLVAAQNVSNAALNEDMARWYEIDVSSGTPTLVQEGDVSGGPGVYDVVPSIAINSSGAIGMTYMQTGTASGQFLSMYVTGRLSTDPLGTMETPILVPAGIGDVDYNGFRDGDMAGINVDPTDGSFWAANEFATLQRGYDWGTAIAHFTVQAPPTPVRTVTISDSSSDGNVIKAGNGGIGGKGGLLPNLTYLPSRYTRPVGGLCGDGGSGGNAQGGGIFLSAAASAAIVQTATLSGVDVSGNSATGGVGGQGAIQDRVGAGVGGFGGSNSGAGGAGGSVEGAGVTSINYSLTVNSSSKSASTFNANTGNAGVGGTGGGSSLTDPNTSYGGDGGAGGSALGGGLAFENDTAIALALSITGASASNNLMTAAAGGVGGAAGTWNHDHILGGSGGAGGQALGGGLYVFASTSAVNTANIDSDALDSNILTAGNGANAGAGASSPFGTAVGVFAAGGDGGDALGGGLYNNNLSAATSGTLNIGYSTMAGNQLTGGNGGLGGSGTTSNGGPGGNGGDGGNAEGGGFYDNNTTTLTVINSTIGGLAPSSQLATTNSNTLIAGSGGAGNNAGTPGGVSAADGGNGGNGGSTEGAGVYANSNAATFINDTIINNQAMNPGLGGAPGSAASGGGNSGTQGTPGVSEGGGYFAASGANSVGNTIIDLNTAVTNYVVSANSYSTADVFGAFTDLGNNILGILTADAAVYGFTASSDQFNVSQASLNLGPLMNNGGPTPTDALLAKSVAIDVGSNALIASYASLFGVTSGTVSNATDQRGPGFPRIDTINDKVDIGAVELTLPLITGLSPSSTEEGSTNVILIITGTGFQTGATVNLTVGGVTTVLTPTNISGNQITVTIPGPLPDDEDGPVSVSVGNPDGSGIQGETLNSNSMQFAITEAPFSLQDPGAQSSNEGASVSLTITPAPPDTLPDVGNFSATGLPSGLTINATTGVISGTISAYDADQSPYNVTVTAYDGPMANKLSASITFQWNVSAVTPPSFTNPGTQNNKEGDTNISVATDPVEEDAGSITATGLPDGLSIDPNSGLITGSIDAYDADNSPYTVTVSATRDGTIQGSITFTWNVTAVTAPGLTNPGTQSNKEGDTVSVATDPVEADAGSITATGLPSGLTIDSTTGVISGIIGAYDADNSPYTVTVSASRGGTVTTKITFTWNVSAVTSPSFTIGNQTNKEGDTVSGVATNPVDADAGSITDVVNGQHTLPPGLTIDPTTGVISGTIAAYDGDQAPYTVTVSATRDGTIQGSITFTWNVADTTPPGFTNPGPQTNKEGDTNISVATDPVDADPGSITATGLPDGLSIDPNTGVITGTIAAFDADHSPYTVIVSATRDGTIPGSMTFTWNVSAVTSPGFTNPGTQNNKEGDTVSVATDPVEADAGSITAIGLPDGLSIDSTTGVISGTIGAYDAGGSPYTVTVSATRGGTIQGSMTFTWNVSAVTPPSFAKLGTQSSKEGETVSLPTTPTDADPGSITATGLPHGLTIDPTSGVISGTIGAYDADHSPYTVTVNATRNGTIKGSITFTWDVTATTPPTLINPGTQSNNETTAINLAIHGVDANNFSATGLPPGLSINPSTGVISGTILGAAGTYQVTVSANRGSHSSSIGFAWVVNSIPLSISITNVQNTYVGLYQVETVTAHVTNPFGIPVNGGIVTFHVNGATLSAPVSNGLATVTFATPMLSLDMTILLNDFFSHAVDAVFSDSAGIFGSAGASASEVAMLIDFLLYLESTQL